MWLESEAPALAGTSHYHLTPHFPTLPPMAPFADPQPLPFKAPRSVKQPVRIALRHCSPSKACHVVWLARVLYSLTAPLHDRASDPAHPSHTIAVVRQLVTKSGRWVADTCYAHDNPNITPTPSICTHPNIYITLPWLQAEHEIAKCLNEIASGFGEKYATYLVGDQIEDLEVTRFTQAVSES